MNYGALQRRSGGDIATTWKRPPRRGADMAPSIVGAGMLVDVETVLTGHGEATVRVRGELDLESADQLRHVVTDLLNSGGTTVIGLDLGELTFVDSTGIGTLVVARRICDQVGVTLRIIAISPFVAHVLNITGVSEQFGVAGLISARNVPA